jgi:hypothetical protein
MKFSDSDAGWIPVPFTDEERKLIIQVGSSRRGAKEASGMSGQKLEADHQFGSNGQVMGYAAEFALAKLLGAEPDTDISRTGNGGEHMRVEHYGRQISFNAAWISDPTYDLRFDPNRVPSTSIYMLLTGDLNGMQIIGGVSRSEFQGKCEERDFGFGLRLVLSQAKLTPARTIARYFGVDGRVEVLEEAHRENRLQREKQYGSLFDPDHQDPA